jgi:hypothetical protein
VAPAAHRLPAELAAQVEVMHRLLSPSLTKSWAMASTDSQQARAVTIQCLSNSRTTS